MAKGGSYTTIEDESVGLQKSNTGNPSSWRLGIFVGSIAFLIIVAVNNFVSHNNTITSPFLSPTKFETTITADDYSSLWTFVRDGYDALPYFLDGKDSYLNYKHLSDYNAVIEPGVHMSFYADDSLTDSYDSLYVKICDPSDTCHTIDTAEDADEMFSYDCAPFDEFTVQITAKSTTKDDVVITGVALCMYVRREIQSLSEDDLEATMDAMYTLWSMSEEEGKEKYGANFHSSTYIAYAHHFNAAQQNADHIHEGLGFLPQHIKLTNIVELAVQAVDPSVSMPYWDFTMEAKSDDSPFDSFMFTEKTFGTLARPEDAVWGFSYTSNNVTDCAILDGRWAYTKAEKGGDGGLFNNYGYLRGPWSGNPSPYISRFATGNTVFPTCKATYGFLEDYTTTKDFLKEVCCICYNYIYRLAFY